MLWFLEPLDEMLAVGVKNWQSMIFQDVAKKGIKMDEDDAEKAEAQEFKETYQPLSEYLKKELGAYINEGMCCSL